MSMTSYFIFFATMLQIFMQLNLAVIQLHVLFTKIFS